MFWLQNDDEDERRLRFTKSSDVKQQRLKNQRETSRDKLLTGVCGASIFYFKFVSNLEAFLCIDVQNYYFNHIRIAQLH